MKNLGPIFFETNVDLDCLKQIVALPRPMMLENEEPMDDDDDDEPQPVNVHLSVESVNNQPFEMGITTEGKKTQMIKMSTGSFLGLVKFEPSVVRKNLILKSMKPTKVNIKMNGWRTNSTENSEEGVLSKPQISRNDRKKMPQFASADMNRILVPTNQFSPDGSSTSLSSPHGSRASPDQPSTNPSGRDSSSAPSSSHFSPPPPQGASHSTTPVSSSKLDHKGKPESFTNGEKYRAEERHLRIMNTMKNGSNKFLSSSSKLSSAPPKPKRPLVDLSFVSPKRNLQPVGSKSNGMFREPLELQQNPFQNYSKNQVSFMEQNNCPEHRTDSSSKLDVIPWQPIAENKKCPQNGENGDFSGISCSAERISVVESEMKKDNRTKPLESEQVRDLDPPPLDSIFDPSGSRGGEGGEVRAGDGGAKSGALVNSVREPLFPSCSSFVTESIAFPGSESSNQEWNSPAPQRNRISSVQNFHFPNDQNESEHFRNYPMSAIVPTQTPHPYPPFRTSHPPDPQKNGNNTFSNQQPHPSFPPSAPVHASPIGAPNNPVSATLPPHFGPLLPPSRTSCPFLKKNGTPDDVSSSPNASSESIPLKTEIGKPENNSKKSRMSEFIEKIKYYFQNRFVKIFLLLSVVFGTFWFFKLKKKKAKTERDRNRMNNDENVGKGGVFKSSHNKEENFADVSNWKNRNKVYREIDESENFEGEGSEFDHDRNESEQRNRHHGRHRRSRRHLRDQRNAEWKNEKRSIDIEREFADSDDVVENNNQSSADDNQQGTNVDKTQQPSDRGTQNSGSDPFSKKTIPSSFPSGPQFVSKNSSFHSLKNDSNSSLFQDSKKTHQNNCSNASRKNHPMVHHSTSQPSLIFQNVPPSPETSTKKTNNTSFHNNGIDSSSISLDHRTATSSSLSSSSSSSSSSSPPSPSLSSSSSPSLSDPSSSKSPQFPSSSSSSSMVPGESNWTGPLEESIEATSPHFFMTHDPIFEMLNNKFVL